MRHVVPCIAAECQCLTLCVVHADGRSNAFTSRGSTFVRNDSSTSSVYGASSGHATPASAAAVSRELEVPLQVSHLLMPPTS